MSIHTDSNGNITRTLAESRVWLAELGPLRADLETVFLDLTSGEALGGSTGGSAGGEGTR